MSEEFPRQIANLITEDPNVLKESSNWQHEVEMEEEELEDVGLLGDLMLGVVFTVGADWNEGEKMVRYYPDGSGYPGSPSYFEWEILEIKSAVAVDEDGEDVEGFELTDEWKKKIEAALYKRIDDSEMQDHLASALEGHDEPDPDYEMELRRDRELDRDDYY